MTREQAKELLPIIQAYAEGKTIQFLNGGKWYDVYDTDFYQSPDVYRIKPEPKYRPFKSKEECWNEMLKHQPFGWVIGKIYANFHHIDFIYSCNPNNGYGVRLGNSTICTNFENMFKDFKFADRTPFGIKEE